MFVRRLALRASFASVATPLVLCLRNQHIITESKAAKSDDVIGVYFKQEVNLVSNTFCYVLHLCMVYVEQGYSFT
jgi:hypothetical protein